MSVNINFGQSLEGIRKFRCNPFLCALHALLCISCTVSRTALSKVVPDFEPLLHLPLHNIHGARYLTHFKHLIEIFPTFPHYLVLCHRHTLPEAVLSVHPPQRRLPPPLERVPLRRRRPPGVVVLPHSVSELLSRASLCFHSPPQLLTILLSLSRSLEQTPLSFLS